jgi:hypothetical protein
VQVLELVRLMCFVEGRVCGMLYLTTINKKHNPADWQQQIISGAKAMKLPVVIDMDAADGCVLLHPKNNRVAYSKAAP